MLPPAPPTFSITIGWPSVSRIRSAMMRAAASVDPPGGNGTIRLSGREGKVWACTVVAAHTTANSAAISLLITPSPIYAQFLRSVYFSGALQRFLQFLERKIFAARDLQDRRLAAAAQFAGVGQLCRKVVGNDDGAMLVGMDQVIGLHGHAGDAHLAAEILRMHPGMRRADRAGQRLEARRPLRDV